MFCCCLLWAAPVSKALLVSASLLFKRHLCAYSTPSVKMFWPYFCKGKSANNSSMGVAMLCKKLSGIVFVFLMSVWVQASFAGVFFDDGFESGDLSYRDPVSGAGWSSSNYSSGDSVSVSSSMSHSGSHSLKFFFKGDASLADDAWAEQRFTLGSPRDEVFMRYYIYFPSNYVIRNDPNGPENTKIFRLWGDLYSPSEPIKVGMSIGSSENLFFEAKTGGPWPYQLNCAGTVDPVPDQTTWILTGEYLGKWTSFEFHIKKDSGSGDGIFQMYVDGVLVKDQQNLSWEGAPCAPGYFLNGYLMGWSNSGFSQDTTVYIDDVVFSDSYIGTTEAGVSPAVRPQPPADLQIQ